MDILNDIIEVQVVFEMEQEEVQNYCKSKDELVLKHLVKRIEEVRLTKKNYLELLN